MSLTTSVFVLDLSQVIGTLHSRPVIVLTKHPSYSPTLSQPLSLTSSSGGSRCQPFTTPIYRSSSGSPSSHSSASACSSSSLPQSASTTSTSSSGIRTTSRGRGPICGCGSPLRPIWALFAAACRGSSRWSSRGGPSAQVPAFRLGMAAAGGRVIFRIRTPCQLSGQRAACLRWIVWPRAQVEREREGHT